MCGVLAGYRGQQLATGASTCLMTLVRRARLLNLDTQSCTLRHEGQHLMPNSAAHNHGIYS
jgi:hypothetical protein